MRKKINKKLLIFIFSILLVALSYLSSPFLINFNEEKKIGFENIISEITGYKVDIKGGIKYKPFPLPKIELSEIHFSKNTENSILDKMNLRVSVHSLFKTSIDYGNIVLEGGEFLIDLEDVKKLSKIEEFKRKKEIKIKNVNLKFFNKANSFSFNSSYGEIFYNNSNITIFKLKKFFVGEVPFNLNFNGNELSINSKKINTKFLLSNLADDSPILKINYNNKIFFPSLRKLYAEFDVKKIDSNFSLKSKVFKTNLLKGDVDVLFDLNQNKTINFKGNFDNPKLVKINTNELVSFLKNDLNFLSSLFDINFEFIFNNFEFSNSLFENANLNFSFQSGDILVNKINFFSKNNKLEIKGRNVVYEKDNLFLYDLIFQTNNIKQLCKDFCENKNLLEKINKENFKLVSKGILNINKGKIEVEENFTDNQYNDNQLKLLNANLNSLILFGNLENLFNVSRYFLIY
jgi:hypothetical protein